MKKLYNKNTGYRHSLNSGRMVIKHDVKNENGNLKHKKNRSMVFAINNGNFYSDEEHISTILKNEMERLNVKPVIEVDPSTVKIDKPKMTEAERAFMLARKYKHEDPSNTLKNIWLGHRNKKMSKTNINIVLRIVSEIKLRDVV